MIVRHAHTIVVEEKHVTDCVGYVADQITITEDDAKILYTMIQQNPERFKATVAQLLARFPCNRV